MCYRSASVQGRDRLCIARSSALLYGTRQIYSRSSEAVLKVAGRSVALQEVLLVRGLHLLQCCDLDNRLWSKHTQRGAGGEGGGGQHAAL